MYNYLKWTNCYGVAMRLILILHVVKLWVQMNTMLALLAMITYRSKKNTSLKCAL